MFMGYERRSGGKTAGGVIEFLGGARNEKMRWIVLP